MGKHSVEMGSTQDDKAAQQEQNTARRSAEISLKRECLDVSKIMKVKPFVGSLLLKHLGNLGLRDVHANPSDAGAPSRFTKAKRKLAERRLNHNENPQPLTMASFARAGFAIPTNPLDIIPTKYLIIFDLSVKLLKYILRHWSQVPYQSAT